MKKTKYLAILVCALLLSVICGGGFALADEPSAWYYYGVRGEPDTLKVNFESGVELILDQLRGYEQVAVRIGQMPPVPLDKNQDDDLFRYPVRGEALRAVDGDYLSMELTGTINGQIHLLWKVNAEHSPGAAARVGLRFMDMKDGASGSAGAGNRIGLSVNGREVVDTVADGDNSFAFDPEVRFEQGDEVVFTIYDEGNATAPCYQTLPYRADENGNLTAVQMKTLEYRDESLFPVLRVSSADGQEKVYGFNREETIFVSVGEIGIGCPAGGEWSVVVTAEKTGVKPFAAQYSGPEMQTLPLEEIMPAEGGYQIDVTRFGGAERYSLRVVRDLTAPRLYLPSDDKLTAPLQDGAVIPKETSILLVRDEYCDDPLVSIGGQQVPVTPREIGQKKLLTFELEELEDGEFKVSVFDVLGNGKTYSLVQAKTELALKDVDAKRLLTTKNPECILSGIGEPGAVVMFCIDGAETREFAIVDESGEWTAMISVGAFESDGEKQLALFYGGDEANVVQTVIAVDTECGLKLDGCEAGKTVLSGETDEYAVVTFSGLGQVMTVTADAQGKFAFALNEPLKANDSLKFVAEDMFGNLSAVLNKQVVAQPVLELDAHCSVVTTQTARISGKAANADFVIIGGAGLRADVLPDGTFSSDIPPQQAGTVLEIYAIEESGNQASEHIVLTVEEPEELMVNVEQPVPNVPHNYAEKLRVKGYAFSKEGVGSFKLIVGDREIGSAALVKAEPTNDALDWVGARGYTNCFGRFDVKVSVSALPLGTTSIRLAAENGEIVCEIPIELIKSAENLPMRIGMLAVLLAGFAVSVVAFVRIGKKMSRIRGEAKHKKVRRDSNSCRRDTTDL